MGDTGKAKLRLDRLDLLLIASLVLVLASYGLGYKMDFGQADPAPATQVDLAAPEVASTESAEPAPAEESKPAPVAAAKPAAVVTAPKTSWDEMTQELTRLAQRRPGRVAIFLKDMKSGMSWSYHPDDLFPSASLIKVPIMASVFAKIKEGDLSLYQKLTLKRRHRTGGSGSLKWSPDGTRLTIAQLLEHMIVESDNTAASMLIEAVGMESMQQAFPKLGLLYTGISQDGMSLRGGLVEHENYTTAHEMGTLMEKIYNGELVDKDSSRLMFEILKRRRPASRLAKGLPRGWGIAHKTGLLRHACHDSAVVMTPSSDYVLTVLTSSGESYSSAKDFITRVGRLTYAHYGAPTYASLRRRHHVAIR
jgi:beta-lactamase class A